jgi:PTH1 family peptidyl-tRNA hydrolase
VERLADRLGAGRFKHRFAGRFAEAKGPDGPLALLVPTTYMNLSGDAVGPAAGSLKARPEQVLVVHDDLDLPFGAVRGKVGGGAGGHNGLRSITSRLGSGDYLRIRIGIGRPPAEFRGDQADWVLMAFSEPAAEVEDMLARALAMTEATIAKGIDAAIATFHASEPGARARERRLRREDEPAPADGDVPSDDSPAGP